MRVETKYELEQELWTITIDAKVLKFKVRKIDIVLEKGRQCIMYLPEDSYMSYYEHNCFPTKEALIAHLGL